MEMYKVKDYKSFAIELEKQTGCEIKIRVIGKNHTHFQLDKMGVSLGVLCICCGEVSFAPFTTLDLQRDDMFINVRYFPMLDDFVHLLLAFREMFVITDSDYWHKEANSLEPS